VTELDRTTWHSGHEDQACGQKPHLTEGHFVWECTAGILTWNYRKDETIVVFSGGLFSICEMTQVMYD
jgi:uncharacterized cupin superfamily protein